MLNYCKLSASASQEMVAKWSLHCVRHILVHKNHLGDFMSALITAQSVQHSEIRYVL